MTNHLIKVENLKIRFGNKWVHNNLSFDVKKNEIVGIVGKSGSGKTTLLRALLMLQQYDSGSIQLFNQEVAKLSLTEREQIQKRWGILFQQNALFTALSVLENIKFPFSEKYHFSENLMDKLALQKLLSVGLEADSANKYPSQLSGGMQKRAALARALALDPELLFLDEPTAGLDPESASKFDELILNLQKALGLTVVIVTHDLDTLWRVTNRVAFLFEGKVLAIKPIAELIKEKHDAIQSFFNGPRGRTAQINHGDNHGNEC